MYNDIISESWVIQEAVQKGRREELNRLILKLVQGRYPEIIDLTQKQIDRITEIEPLENLLDVIIRAQSIQEVLEGFISLDQH